MQRLLSCLMVFILMGTVFFASPVSPSPLHAQGTDTNTLIDDYVNELMSLYEIPGASIAIVQDGEILYSKAFGVKDTSTNEPVTPETQFAIGSISKSFTALAIAQLVDAGVFDLDTPIIQYWPEFRLATEEATQNVTLRHILSQSSGLRAYSDDFWYYSRPTRAELVADMVNIEVVAAPGTLFQYNNQNFALAGWLIEHVTGQTWEDYVRQYIFSPLDMPTANFDIADMQATGNYASPHSLSILEGMQPIPFFDGLAPIGPSGSINANSIEMANYVAFQLGDGTFNGQEIVSQALLDEMHTQQIEGYGLGWVIQEHAGLDIVWHNGSIDGFSSNLVLVPEKNLGAVVLSNEQNFSALFTQAVLLGIIDRLLGLEVEPPIEMQINQASSFDPASFAEQLLAARRYESDPAQLETFVGEYQWASGEMYTSIEDGRLHLHIAYTDGQDYDLELIQFEADKFLVNSRELVGTLFRFEQDDAGSIHVYQEQLLIATRPAAGVDTSVYVDGAGRFQFAPPNGLLPQAITSDLVLIISEKPSGAYLIGTAPISSDSISDNVRDLIAGIDPTFTLEPDKSTEIELNGQTWTELRYSIPGNQVIVARAIHHDNTVYVVMIQILAADYDSARSTFDALTSSFEIID